MKVTRALAMALTIGILYTALPAQSVDFSQTLQTFSTSVRGWDDFESRIARLESELSQTQTQSQLGVDQVAEFKRQLMELRAAATQGKASGRRMNLVQMFKYTNELNTLTGTIQQAVSDAGSPTTNNDINNRHDNLERQIETKRRSGKLTQQDAEELRQDLKRVTDFEASAKAANGGVLSARDNNRVLRRLDRVKASLDQAIVMSDAAVLEINNRKTILRSKIGTGVSANKLTNTQQDQFTAELNRIDSMQADALTDLHLSGTETLALATALDKLNTSIEQASATDSTPVQPPVVTTPPVDTTTQQPYTPSGSSYGDVQGHWGEPYISTLASRGIIGGFPDGTFKPNNEITRGQFAAIASKALNIPPVAGGASFRDVPSTHWAANVINAVSSKGLVTGFPDGTFKPEDKITRAQALIILAKALNNAAPDSASLQRYRDAGQVPAWAQESVSKAAQANIIVNFPDSSVIRPNSLATRAEVAALTYQTLVKTGRDLPQLTIGMLNAPPNEPPVATTVPQPVEEKLFISDVRISPSENVLAGDTITVTAYGSPQANGTFSMANLAQNVPMHEIRKGVYEGSYTVRRTDNVARPRVTVTFNKSGAESATLERQLGMSLDASAPRIMVIGPLDKSTIGTPKPSISARFNDARGSGIDRGSVTLLVNGQDVTPAATIQRNMVTYTPTTPLSNRVTAEVRISDQSGNVSSERWSFFVR